MTTTRRRFLVGTAGAVLALPALEAWLDRGPRARAGGPERPRFVAWVRAGNGVAQAWGDEPEQFWPRATGPLTTEVLGTRNADRATSELAPYAARLSLVKGVERPFGTPSCGHAESLPQCLTGRASTGGTSNSPLATGPSADWIIARQKNAGGREPLTLMAGPGSAYIAEGLSWSEAGVRTPAERSPFAAYMRMVGLSSAPPEVQRRIAARRASVNDLVREQMRGLLGQPALSTRDRERLQQHFDAIRDTEVRVTCEEDPAVAAAIGAIADPEANDVRPEVVRRHMDLVAFAFRCDLNRAATIQVGEGNDQTQYDDGGTRLPRFHWISHRIYSDGADGTPIPDAVTLHHRVDRLQLGMFRYLLDRLDEFPSIYGGTLLDDSAAVWLNDLGAGPPHSGRDVPWIIAGSAGGALRTGQFVDLGGVGLQRVLNTLLDAAGCTHDDGTPIDDFGDPALPGGFVDALRRV